MKFHWSAIDLRKAIKEVQSKEEAVIEYETAIKWVYRAAACYILCKRVKDNNSRAYWFARGDDMRHEALEHASLCEDGGELVGQLAEFLEMYRLECGSCF